MPSGNKSSRDAREVHARGFDSGSSSARPFIPILLFAVAFLLCLGRLIYLQVIVADEYSSQAAETRTVNINTTPRRGTIYDRNGIVLACSVDATTIYANPAEVTDIRGEANQLSAYLGGKIEDYMELLSTSDTTFVYIKRKADVTVAEKIEELELPGIYFIEDTRREYPCKQVAGQVVGFCNIDGEGIAGLELYYDEILAGTPGTLECERGLNGAFIPGGVHERTRAIDGTDIMISIDVDMQAHLEQVLLDYEKSMKVKTHATMVDTSTGEILACASLPLFNPADTSKVEEGATQLKPVTHPYEPGSIFKTVSAATILENHVMEPEDEMFCPAELPADEYVVTDAHARGDETMTLRQIINMSSNIGISLCVEKMGFDKLNDAILRYHLNDETGVDYPGEGCGYLLDFDYWSKIQGYNITFGQGIQVSPLQVIRFYGALINNGYETVPHFLIALPETGEQKVYEKEQVLFDQDAMDKTCSMLETVVTDGTGKPAAIDGYHSAGKTGTAEIASEEGGYKPGVYNISFTGFLNRSSSKIVCFTGAYDYPADGSTAAIFASIMNFAIDRYKIAPE